MLPRLADAETADERFVHDVRPAGDRIHETSPAADGAERFGRRAVRGYRLFDGSPPEVELIRHVREDREFRRIMPHRLTPHLPVGIEPGDLRTR